MTGYIICEEQMGEVEEWEKKRREQMKMRIGEMKRNKSCKYGMGTGKEGKKLKKREREKGREEEGDREVSRRFKYGQPSGLRDSE